MIAPVRRPPARKAAAHRGLSTARRAVAAALIRATRPSDSTAPPVSRRAAWLFVAWTVAVAVSYFVAGAWWTIPRY